MPLHILHHHDGVVHHETDGEDDGQQRQEVDGKAEGLHQKDAADKRYRDGHHRHQHGAEGTEKEEDYDDHDEQGVDQGLDDLMDGVGDIIGGVIGDMGLHTAGQLFLDGFHLRPHPFDHVDGVGVGQRPDPHEDCRFSGEMHLGAIVLGPEDHLAHIFQADDGPVFFPDDQLFEFTRRAQVGIGRQVDLDQRSLGLAHGGQEVVGGQGLPDHGRTDIVGCHPLGIQPDTHGKGPATQDIGPLDTFQCREPGLYDPDQIVGDLVLVQILGREAQVGRGKLAVRRLHVQRRDLGLGREVSPDLIHLGADLG